MLNIKVCIVSKDQNAMMSENDFAENEFCKFTVDMHLGNSTPLANIYNDCMDASNGYDYVMLMHSDVKFNILDFSKHLSEIDGKYDIIGLCGTSKLVVSECPLNWYTGSRSCPKNRWGCVTHGELNNQTSYFSQHSKDILDHEVSCIDGLCIIVSKNAMSTGIKFDPNVGAFDLYDTDFSMQAMINYKLKLGVMVTMDLQHYSVGKSIMTEEFLVNDRKFRDKWHLPLPMKK